MVSRLSYQAIRDTRVAGLATAGNQRSHFIEASPPQSIEDRDYYLDQDKAHDAFKVGPGIYSCTPSRSAELTGGCSLENGESRWRRGA